MALQHDDLALLSARFGVARFGASRFGFIPCPEDVEGASNDEPGEYIWREVQPPTTEWTLVGEDCVCRDLCTLELSETLKAYWKLDEASGTRVDSAGDYDLTPVNTPGSVAGQIDNAATFLDSSSQYLTNENFIPLDGANGITVAAWINVRTGAPVSATYFYNGLTFNDYIYLTTANAGAKWIFFGAINTEGETTNAGVELASFDTWYFVVGKFDPATGKTYLKVDAGAWIEGSGGLPSGVNIYSGSVFVGTGAHLGAAAAFSRSYMDELGVWNKILSQDEIDAMIALTRPDFVADIVTDEDVTLDVILDGVLGTVDGHAQINWGDGRHDQQDISPLEDGVLAFTGHYHVAGTYTITVTVTDERGCVATATKEVTVVAPSAIVASFMWTKDAEENLVFFTDTSTGGPDTWAWDFGDLTPEDNNQNPSHSYTLNVDPDVTTEFVVTLTASLGGDSDVATDTLVIAFNPAASGSGS